MTATKKAAPVLEHRDGQRVEKSRQALSAPILPNRREFYKDDYYRNFKAWRGKRNSCRHAGRYVAGIPAQVAQFDSA